MSLLLSCQSLQKSYGPRPLFRDVSIVLSEGDKVGLIGPNGSGKSTLMKILVGQEDPDGGELSRANQTQLAYVPQVSKFDEAQSVESIVDAALTFAHLEDYERVNKVQTALSRVGFSDPSQHANTLSGGWKKRLSIACALANEPDLLLMDEPTNHLDLEGIHWLEGFLQQASFAYLVISHDRYFLEAIAKRVIELNPRYPEGTLAFAGNYSRFLEKREEFFAIQLQQQESLATKVRREVEWLRRGPKARTTKAKFRIDAAHKMISELADAKARNNMGQKTSIDFTASGRKSKELLVAKQVSKALGGRTLFRDLDVLLSPGSRLGLVGPNGSGKTTLIRLLTGALAPDEGILKRVEGLRIVHFDQNRETLDPDLTLRRALAPDGDQVVFRERPLHVASWARRFLFRDEQLDMRVGLLSGGEQSRIQIARLMLRPADLLILDEPTNDLDLPTLEVLEENLLEFPGSLVLVTHDRFMLDRVSTHILGLDGDGEWGYYAEYAQWSDARKAKKKSERKKKEKPTHHAPRKKAKLSYKEKKEWESMEGDILEAEERLEEKQAMLETPEVATDPAKLQTCYEEMQAAQAEVDRLYARWEELEAKLKGDKA